MRASRKTSATDGADGVGAGLVVAGALEVDGLVRGRAGCRGLTVVAASREQQRGRGHGQQAAGQAAGAGQHGALLTSTNRHARRGTGPLDAPARHRVALIR